MHRLPLQVAFLTGQSRPPSTALSPVQTRFLASLPVAAEGRMPRNFPYGSTDQDLHQTAPLLAASLRNGWQYWRSRRPDFRSRYRPVVKALLDGANHTLFLAGSCGLELFNNLGLSARDRDRVSVFAFGPVARRRPECEHFFVQGHGDWLSRRYFSKVHARVEAGHLEYLEVPEVLALAVKMIDQLGALSADPAVSR